MTNISTLEIKHYEAIINSSHEAIIAKDMNGIITSWNPAAEKLYGYSSKEAVGKSITIIFPKDKKSELPKIMKRIKSEERVDDYETIRVSKGGERIWVSLTISPIKDDSGKIVGASVIARDISQNKKNEREKDFLIEAGEILASSINYEETLQNVAKLAVPQIADWCAIDILNEEGKIERIAVAHKDPEKVKWAESLQKEFPVDPEAATGVPNVIRTKSTEFYSEVTEELIEKAVEGARLKDIIKKIGMRSVIISPLTAHGKTFGALTLVQTKNSPLFTELDCELAEELARRSAVAIDNSQLYKKLHQANEELERAVSQRTEELADAVKELKRSNKELEDFAKVASHDLHEPLRKIYTFGNMLETQEGTRLSKKSQRNLERMLRSTKRMRDLLEALLSYSQVTINGQVMEEIDLNKLLSEVLEDLEVSIKESEAEITVKDLPTIEANPQQMRQVFQNLISNSIKFRKKDTRPKVVISSESDENEENKITLIVKDNGIGFKQEYSEKIFTVFERLHGRGEYRGTGIGLTVVRKIISRHGGKISAKGKPSNGATFIITLPKNQNGNHIHSLVG